MVHRGRLWQNWGRSAGVHPELVARPTSVEEVIAVVRYARDRGLRVKPIGAGHSFSGIALATGIQLDLTALTGLLAVDRAAMTATLAAGTTLRQIPALLQPHQLAMENLGDIDAQTISGATATGTHGTGSAFRGLAAQIVSATLVTAEGTVLTVSETEHPDLLPAVKLGVGALGVIVDLTIACVPAFLLHALERPEPVEAVLENFEETARGVDHFEFYWFPHTDTALTKTNSRLDAGEPAAPLPKVRRWVDDVLVSNAALSLACGIGTLAPAATPAINRLATRLTGHRQFTDTSAAVFTTRRSVRFREMEYALPRQAVPDALRAVRALIERLQWRISFPIEVRVAAADDLWLSTAYGRDTGYIAVHRYFREDYHQYFRAVEAIMRDHGGRPHWGKIHFQQAVFLRESYPRFDDFLAVRDRLDPDRVFANRYLERVLGP
ncbi:D-arabinono-1,4-lactone oxidase [Parafrigoribacterium mesophilum]|uniref:D-arabinono-1,4-lactone oxidase n=1 Tax=Parafrigoribacterium mesophilum TaxID=433646 RepID=UPI003D1592E8